VATSAKKTTEEELEDEGTTDKELEESVEAGLSKVFNESSDDGEEKDEEDTDDNEQADDGEEVGDSTPEDDDEDEKDDEKQAEEDNEDDDSTPDDEEEKDEAKEKSDVEEEITLPEAYYRAAIHQGWKPDEITEYFEATPELAVRTFAKIHETTNKLSKEFAKIGRMKPAKEKEVVAKTDDTADKDTAAIAALKAEYGEDSAVVKIVLEQQKTIDKLAAKSEPGNQDAEEELNPAIVDRIQKFFIDPSLKPYNDFYGKGKDEAKLTREQSDHRYEVLETADSIVMGCQRQGREITLEEALEKAHLIVSEPVRVEGEG